MRPIIVGKNRKNPNRKRRAGGNHKGGLPSGVTMRTCSACGIAQRLVVGSQETCSACGEKLAL